MTAAGRTTNHQHVVMVVDDSDVARESLGLLLQMEGHRVATVPSGLEALHLLLTLGFRPCVILTDLIMPKMDGLTFHAEQQKHPRIAPIPVIALTAHEGLRRHALEVGFAAALLKPCDFPTLFGLIYLHCRQTRPLHVAKRV
jgi:CheY-like chemotaxis protein